MSAVMAIIKEQTEQRDKRIAELEAALREIEHEARRANVDDGDGGDHLLLLIEGTARDALRHAAPGAQR